MITGHVSVYREPVISVTVGSPSGAGREIDAVVDTGFSGFLTLPAQVIQELGLAWRRRGRAMLADGSDSLFDIFEGTVLWNRTLLGNSPRFHPYAGPALPGGKLRRIAVDEAECHPLVGMALLQGHELTVHAVVGGRVTIRPMP